MQQFQTAASRKGRDPFFSFLKNMAECFDVLGFECHFDDANEGHVG
jgi:hypothetical protein